MHDISGIRTVELKVYASGFGIVNWNGKKQDSDFANHLVPKIRTNKTTKEHYIYVSENCTRHHLYKDEAHPLATMKARMISSELQSSGCKFQTLCHANLASSVGLVRGYMLTGKNSQSYGRKSPLLVEDFIEKNKIENTNEIFTQAWAVDENGNRGSNSLFYRHSLGSTSYEGFSVIDIENLQFISLDSTLGNSAFPINPLNGEANVQALVSDINGYLKKVASRLTVKSQSSPKVTAGHFKRKNGLLVDIEYGLLLNNSAIDVMVLDTIRRFSSLSIIQGKGLMKQIKLRSF